MPVEVGLCRGEREREHLEMRIQRDAGTTGRAGRVLRREVTHTLSCRQWGRRRRVLRTGRVVIKATF